MINIYYYRQLENDAQAYNWGLFAVMSYYLRKNPDKDISVNEIIDVKDFRKIKNEKNSFVLISIPFFESLGDFDSIMSRLRQEFNDITKKKFNIIIGGASIHQLSSDDLHEFYPELNFIIRGRGEVVLDKILNGEITDNGVYDGNSYKLSPTTMVDFFSSKLDNVSIPIMIDGLTCPWNKCQFCLHAAKDPISLGSKQAFDIIKYYYVEQNKKEFYLCDNWLNMGKLYRILDMLLAEGMTDVCFDFFGSHISSNYKRLGEYANKFDDGFIKAVTWGVEFLDDEVLELYQKGITVEQIFEHAKYIKDIGLKLDAYMIMGLPNIQEKHIDNMYNNLLEYDQYVDFYSYSTFTLDEGIPVFKNPEKFGIEILNKATTDYQFGTRYKIGTTIYGYKVYDFEEEKYISSHENILRFKKITDIMSAKNIKNNYFVRSYAPEGYVDK